MQCAKAFFLFGSLKPIRQGSVATLVTDKHGPFSDSRTKMFRRPWSLDFLVCFPTSVFTSNSLQSDWSDLRVLFHMARLSTNQNVRETDLRHFTSGFRSEV